MYPFVSLVVVYMYPVGCIGDKIVVTETCIIFSPLVYIRGVVCQLAASAGPESVTRAMGAAEPAPHEATIASADQTPLPRL